MHKKNTLVIVAIVCCFIVLAACNKEVKYEQQNKPESSLNAGDKRLTASTLVLSSDTVYVLGTSLVRDSGQVLQIEPGTLIKVRNRLSVTIRSGAKIDARGTREDPIVFTSNAFTGSAGVTGSDGSGTNSWYGIRIYGNADKDSSSNSGILEYLRIEFAGADENFTSLPSLLLDHVGSATTINHVQVSYSFATSSFGFNGGTCNASQLFSFLSGGPSDFSLTGGYKGRMQFLIGYRHPYFPLSQQGSNLTGMFISGAGTAPAVSNASIIGPGYGANNSVAYILWNPRSALIINAAAKFHIKNSFFGGFPGGGFFMGDRQSAIALNSGESDFSYSIISSKDSSESFTLPSYVYPPFGSSDFRQFMLNPNNFNRVITKIEDLQLENFYKYQTEVPLPSASSPLLTGADFNSSHFNNSFFENVSFIGAIGRESWTDTWTNLNPLQTRYNQ